jgi:hypothetical protein
LDEPQQRSTSRRRDARMSGEAVVDADLAGISRDFRSTGKVGAQNEPIGHFATGASERFQQSGRRGGPASATRLVSLRSSRALGILPDLSRSPDGVRPGACSSRCPEQARRIGQWVSCAPFKQWQGSIFPADWLARGRCQSTSADLRAERSAGDACRCGGLLQRLSVGRDCPLVVLRR